MTVHLPWPPSVNRIWRHRGKQVYRDPKYVAWLEEAGWMIKLTGAHLKPIAGPFSCEMVLTPPDKRRRDLDNVIKATLDLFQTAKIIEDDQWCHQLMVRYDFKATKPGTCVSITAM